jgi:three-Cys-motif partner protein
MSFLEVKAHSKRKHSILRKYLGACKVFSDKYQNFAYVDTHGGTGEVIDFETKKNTEGSVLVAASLQPSFPCYVVEIDPDNYKLLQQSTQKYPHVTLFPGDCNEKIDDILKLIPKGRKFVFCFLDPDSLMYGAYDQLKWETIEKIAKFPRTEVLVNVPTFTIMRCAAVVRDYPEASSSIKMARHITDFYGSNKWEDMDPGDYRGLARLYILERLRDYKYTGAILIRSISTRGPLYYLVCGSNNPTGARIMRDIISREWLDIIKSEPLTKIGKTKTEWLDSEYPLDEPFIFED